MISYARQPATRKMKSFIFFAVREFAVMGPSLHSVSAAAKHTSAYSADRMHTADV